MTKLSGFDEFIKSCDEMKVSDNCIAQAMEQALKVPQKSAEQNAPYQTGKTKKSIKVKIKRLKHGGVIGRVYVDNFTAIFQEFRNSRQSGKHIGWFERSIHASEDNVIECLKREIMK